MKWVYAIEVNYYSLWGRVILDLFSIFKAIDQISFWREAITFIAVSLFFLFSVQLGYFRTTVVFRVFLHARVFWWSICIVFYFFFPKCYKIWQVMLAQSKGYMNSNYIVRVHGISRIICGVPMDFGQIYWYSFPSSLSFCSYKETISVSQGFPDLC